VQAELLALGEAEFAAALAVFSLPAGDSKPDLLHWLPLLNRLDEVLETAAVRADVRLLGAEGTPFPSAEILAALRVTALLLEGSHNRQLYGSAEVRAVPRQLAVARPVCLQSLQLTRTAAAPRGAAGS
jgi:hypothetical protein